MRLDRPDEMPVPLFDTSSNETYPALSPDGRWLAYVDDSSGQNEVRVVRYPELDEGVQVSTGGGYMPTWSPKLTINSPRIRTSSIFETGLPLSD